MIIIVSGDRNIVLQLIQTLAKRIIEENCLKTTPKNSEMRKISSLLYFVCIYITYIWARRCIISAQWAYTHE